MVGKVARYPLHAKFLLVACCFYLKPGQKLRVKQALARKRNRKKARREPELPAC
jgi:hypothetical protein